MEIEELSYKDIDYIGDGCYIGHDNFSSIVLFTYDGISISNEIWIELPYMLDSILDYYKKHFINKGEVKNEEN